METKTRKRSKNPTKLAPKKLQKPEKTNPSSILQRSSSLKFQIGSKNILNNRNLIKQATGKYKEEFYALQDSYSPSCIKFREKEKEIIKSYIQNSFQKEGSNSALYITGLPGLGKTACVLEVIQNLMLDRYFYYINGLKLLKPALFYTELWNLLSGIHLPPNEAQKTLVKFFAQQHLQGLAPQAYQFKLLVIDEIDFLMTTKQDVLYNIFDWQHQSNSKMSIICIANTLDFYNRLIPKIQSRMGQNQMPFKPYLSSEIEEIFKERIGNSNLFTKDAITFIAKKTTNFSSDIRKVMHIGRRCIQLYSSKYKNKSQIDIEVVNEVFIEEQKKPLVTYISGSSDMIKLFLISVLFEFKVKNSNVFFSEDIYRRINDIQSQRQEKPMQYYLFQQILEHCDEMRIIKIKHDQFKQEKIELKSDCDDISLALNDDPIYNKFGPLKYVYETKIE